MKKNLKQSLLISMLMQSVCGIALAQPQPQPQTQNIIQPELKANVVANTNESVQIKKGNSFEKEVTPLLREISRKKSQLELRKLDRELEKIDEESLKAQLDMETASKGGKSNSGEGAVYDPFAGATSSAMPIPKVNPLPETSNNNIALDAPPTSSIKVLMIYGFDGELSAKIASGEQGGYVVKKGDVMPDGRIVYNVTANYIEIKKSNKKASKSIERIFVSSSLPSTDSSSNMNMAKIGGSASSTNLIPTNENQNQNQNQNANSIANATAASQILAPMAPPTPINKK